MVKYIFYAIMAYILYKFIFKLVIPVYQASRKIKKGFREMHTRMEEQMKPQQQQDPPPASSPKTKAGEYIDFEEV
jgi:hypothetical protein